MAMWVGKRPIGLARPDGFPSVDADLPRIHLIATQTEPPQFKLASSLQ